MKLPRYHIRQRPLLGTRYVSHSIELADGGVVHAQLSPYGAGEAEARVREFLAPASNTPPPRFVPYNYSKPGPKPKGRKGESWRDHSWLKGDDE